MSQVVVSKAQIGQSGTSSNNFHFRNLLDGLLRLSRGSHDAPSPTDVMTVNADNSVGFPGNVASGVLGAGQTWQNVTASRALATTYTNTSGRPIMVSVVMYTINSATVSQLTVGGVVVAKHGANIGGGPNSNLRTQMTAVVPAGASYSATGTSLDTWAELR